MELVVDANILMSALISTEGKTFDLMLNNRIKLFSVEKLLEEIKEHEPEILAKSGLSEYELELFLSLVSAQIEFIPYPELKGFIPEAEKITPDIDDTEYLALALKLKCSIWSNDKKLKEQDKIKVYTTNEIIELILNKD